MKRVFLFSCLLLSSSLAQANASQLEGEAIRKAISGKRIYLAVPFGGEFPLYYRPDGRVDGSGEAIGLGRWLRPTDTGRWWISGNQLCQQWTTWYEGKKHCFVLQRSGEGRLAWFKDNGERGVARVGN